MSSCQPTPLRGTTLRRSLERALAESTDPEVRFHIRQALQLVA